MVKDRVYNRRLLFFYIAMLLLIVTAPFFGGKVFILAATALFCGALLVLKIPSMYVLLLGLFPFANIFKLSPTSSSMLTICELILCVYIVLVHGVLGGKMRIKTSFVVLWILFIGYIAFVPGVRGGVLPVVKMAVRLLLLYTFFQLEYEAEFREKTIRMMVYVLGFSMVLMMALSKWELYLDKVVGYLRIVQYGQGASVVRNGGLMDDPNYCSLAIMATLTILTVMYYYKQIGWHYWLLAVPLFLFGFSTYSKSYLLCAVIFVVMLLVYVLFPRHKGMALLVLIAAAVGTALALKGEIEVIDMILDRFDEKDITTGRSALNNVYVNHIFGNLNVLVFGSGYNVQTFGMHNNVHNLYIETLFQLGFFGASLLLSVILSCFPKKHNRTKMVNYLPPLFILVMYTALAGLNSYELVYYIMIMVCSVFFVSERKTNTGYQVEGI